MFGPPSTIVTEKVILRQCLFLSDPSPNTPLTCQYAPQNEAEGFANSLTVGQIDKSKKIRVP